MSQRSVEVAKEGALYRVTTFCRSLPEAMATVDKILHSAPPEAFIVSPQLSADELPDLRPGGVIRATEPLPAHVEALATLDADDAAPRMMDKAEAESR